MADFAIQRGTATIASSATSITITAGTDYTAPSSATKAFIRIVASSLGGDGVTGDFSGGDESHAAIDNPSNLLTSITFSRAGSPAEAMNIQWEIIEYTGAVSGAYEFVVRHVENLNFSTTDTTLDSSSVSGISTDADVVVFITGQGFGDTAGRGNVEEILHVSEWVISTQVARITRDGSGDGSHVSLAVVEFTGANWRVERITHSYSAAATVETETLGTTLGAVSQAFIHSQIRVGGGSSAVGVRKGGQLAYISSTSQISFYVYEITTSADAVVWLVEDTTGGMSVEQISGTRAADTGSNPDSWTETISTVTIAESSIMGECAYTNAGTDSHYMCVGFRITGTTTATLSRGNINEARIYRFQVVQWPTAAGGIIPQAMVYYMRHEA